MAKLVTGTVVGFVGCASLLAAVGIRQKLVKDMVEAEIAKSGPCLGQEAMARLRGIDIVTAERARSLAAAQGLGVCVDVRPARGVVKCSFMEVFAWPSQRSSVLAAMFRDEEFSHEAAVLLWGPPDNINMLPSPNWMGKSVESFEPHPSSDVVGVIRKALDSPQY